MCKNRKRFLLTSDLLSNTCMSLVVRQSSVNISLALHAHDKSSMTDSQPVIYWEKITVSKNLFLHLPLIISKQNFGEVKSELNFLQNLLPINLVYFQSVTEEMMICFSYEKLISNKSCCFIFCKTHNICMRFMEMTY